MTTYTPVTKNATAFTAVGRNQTAYNTGDDALLQELGDYLLLESGGKILLQEDVRKNITTYTAQTKN